MKDKSIDELVSACKSCPILQNLRDSNRGCRERVPMIISLSNKARKAGLDVPSDNDIHNAAPHVQAILDMCSANFRLQSWMLNAIAGCWSANDSSDWSEGEV